MPPTPSRESDGTLYVVPTVHLDTQWRWTVRDAIRSFLPATVDRNLEIFERLPDFVLNFEGAFRYMLLEEYYPERFERLRQAVAAGRWLPVGGMLDAADVNIPSPESLIRQLLYGSRYFEQRLGRRSLDLFLPDCFGFGHSLPTVAAHCGVEGLSTSKLVRWLAPAARPFDIGRWRGPDGSEILAVLNPEGYGEELAEDLGHAARWRQRIAARGRESGVPVAFMYVGVGDRGGGLGDGAVEWLRRSVEGDGAVGVRIAASDQLFRDLTPAQRDRLPVHDGELLLPTHGTGCLTSQAAMKRWNRANERLADTAERAAAIADWLGVQPYPAASLRDAWIRFLWHQMHDDLTGTSIPAAYRLSWNDEIVALNRFASLLTDSVGAVARALDTAVAGTPLLVFNPLPIGRRDLVTARLHFPGGAPAAVRVSDPDGAAVPVQLLSRDPEALELLFEAELPPLGFALFEALPAERAAAEPADGALAVAPDRLENARLRAEIDGRGELATLFDKRLGRELLAAPLRHELLRDRSARWPAWEVLHEDLGLPPLAAFGHAPRVRVLERGPLRAVLEVQRRAAGSTLVQRLVLGRHSERLEVHNLLDWRTRGRLLKVAFPLAAGNPTATYDLGIGTIARGNNRREAYEVPAQRWADLTAAAAGFGVTVLSDSRYGWDKPDDATLRLSLARSPRVIRKFRHQGRQDLGPHRFGWALWGHAEPLNPAAAHWQAERFERPPLAFRVPRGAGEGRRLSFLALDDPAVGLSALKKSEAGGEWALRLQELAGGEVPRVRVSFAAEVIGAEEIDGVERPLGPARASGHQLETSLGRFRPRAFAARLAPPADTPPPPRCRDLELPHDVAAASFHADGRGVDFDGRGNSLPGELLPAGLRLGGVELALAPARPGRPHALRCRGLEIALDADSAGLLVLVATAVGGDRTTEIAIDGRRRPLRVQDWSEPVGRWADRGRLLGVPLGRRRPPRIRRQPIAWYATHRHDRRGGDQPYVYCYLYRYLFELPAGAAVLRLPDDERVRLFAAAVVTGSGLGTEPAAPLYGE